MLNARGFNSKWAAPLSEVLGIDYRSLGLFRIGLGLMIIWDLISRARFFTAHYTDDGVLPVGAVDVWASEYPIYFKGMFLSGEPWLPALFFLFAGLTAVGFTIGYRTRIMAFFCWFLLISIYMRNDLIYHAGDTLLLMLLFWSMFLPIEKKWSVDTLFNKAGAPITSVRYFSAASIALLFQVKFMYFFAGLYKAEIPTWVDGTHLYLTLSRFEYVLPLGFMVYPYPDLLNVLTHFTLWIEILGPALLLIPFLFGPVRVLVILILVFFQLGMGSMMYVGLFSLVSVVAMIPFLPAWFWERMQNLLKSKYHYVVRFKSKVGGYFSRVCSFIYTYQHEPEQESHKVDKGFSAVAGILILYVFAINIDGLYYGVHTPLWFQDPAKYLNITQRWSLFTTPASHGGWFVGEAKLKNGEKVDILRQGELIDYGEKPQQITREIDNYRWRIYLANNLRSSANEGYRPYFADYLKERWNSNHAEKKAVKEFTFIEYRFEIGEDYDHGEADKNILYSRNATETEE